jgi:release factor glutamine methyltransferase
MGVNIQTIKDILFYLAKELQEVYPEQEISAIGNIVIKNVLGTTKLHQLYMPEQAVTKHQSLKIVEICEELKTGKPVQYVLSETVFYDCIIRLNSFTLIPRQETEELVDLIIRENKGFTGNIIDIGTGSGCIAIALAANLPGAEVTGTDISRQAISISKENAALNNVTVRFLENDIFNFDSEIINIAGIIVSNPPYVRDSEKQFMSKNVLNFEPHLALFVNDNDPLKYYRAILKAAEKILVPGGKVYFEINEAMGMLMVGLLKSAGYPDAEIVSDINSKDRIIKGTKNA